MATPRWKEIADIFRTAIHAGELKAGDLLPSETELSLQYAVCRATAHRAMHELQQQGLVIRKRRKGTIVTGHTRRLTGHVALLVRSDRDALEMEYLRGMRAALPDEYNLLLCDTRRDPQREAYYLRRMANEADGILCIPTCAPSNVPLMRSLHHSGVKLVCVDRLPEGLEVDAVVSDNFGASLKALRYLVEKGHRRIAHFTEPQMHISSVHDRCEAYLQVMNEIGWKDPRRWLRVFSTDSPTASQVVYETLSDLFREPEPITAVFCVHDYILASLMEACHRLRVCVPEDLEIVSFNDCPPLVPYMPRTIHHIEQRAYEIGKRAVERLCRRMRGEAISPAIVQIPPLFHAGVAPEQPAARTHSSV